MSTTDNDNDYQEGYGVPQRRVSTYLAESYAQARYVKNGPVAKPKPKPSEWKFKTEDGTTFDKWDEAIEYCQTHLLDAHTKSGNHYQRQQMLFARGCGRTPVWTANSDAKNWDTGEYMMANGPIRYRRDALRRHYQD